MVPIRTFFLIIGGDIPDYEHYWGSADWNDWSAWSEWNDSTETQRDYTQDRNSPSTEDANSAEGGGAGARLPDVSYDPYETARK